MLSLEAEDYELLGWGTEIDCNDTQLNIHQVRVREKVTKVRKVKPPKPPKPPKLLKPPGPGRGKWKRPQTDPERIREVREHAARMGIEAFNEFLAVGNL